MRARRASFLSLVVVLVTMVITTVIDGFHTVRAAASEQHDGAGEGEEDEGGGLLSSLTYEEEIERELGDGHYDNYDEEEDEYNDDEEHPSNPLSEEERIAEYHKRGYQWPVTDEMYTPNSTGWRALMNKRFEQVGHIDDYNDRYEAYIQTVTTGYLVPNHTEHGFGIARVADEELMEELRRAVREGIPTARLEGKDAVIPGPNPPLFIGNRPDLTERVLVELQRYAETWSNMELLPYGAYGFRVYRNESQLYMHIDKPQTHVISFILHIDSSDDAEPWPLFIEDYYGQTHEVTLTSGDLLFYESCKLLHGRPKPLNGSWYSSVFVHYYPKHGWADRNMEMEAHYAVPPIWAHPIPRKPDDPFPKLDMVETSLVEFDCPNHWCATTNSIKWGGPGEVGVWIAPTQERYPFHPPPYIEPSGEEL